MTEKESWQLMLEMWEYIRDCIKAEKKKQQHIGFYDVSLAKRCFLFERGIDVSWPVKCYFCAKYNCWECPLWSSERLMCTDYGSLYYRACRCDLRAVAWIIRKIKKELEKAKKEE